MPGPCDECGSTDATAMAAAEFLSGRAYIFRVTKDVPAAGAVPLCKGCFWGQAVYEAHRYGYDVHTHHRPAEPCPANCLTRLDGRSIQIRLFDAHAHGPNEMYRICKKWDGLRQRGTFPVNGVKIRTFYDLRVRQLFYEPLTSPEKVRELLRYRRVLASAYVPEWAAPHLALSFRCFTSAFTAPGGFLPLPSVGDPEVEPHAVALWDIEDDDTIVFRNSWGAGWGDRGHGRMTWEYFESYWLEAWAMRNAAVGLNLDTAQRLADAQTDADLRRAWMLPNPPAKKAQRGEFEHIRLVNYTTVSSDSKCPVDVVEARNGYGLRLGWVHVFHPPRHQAERSEMRELFVWPSFRRQGIGSLLEDLAVSLARTRHSKTLRIFLHEADGHVAVRANGRRFGQARGYTWRWRAIEHPRLTAVADKAI